MITRDCKNISVVCMGNTDAGTELSLMYEAARLKVKQDAHMCCNTKKIYRNYLLYFKYKACISIPAMPRPTILGEFGGADQSGNLEAVFRAIFSGCEVG